MANMTKIGAVLDKQIIKVFYRHMHTTNVAASQLKFNLKHSYTSKSGSTGELELEQVSVPVDFVRVGLVDSSYVYEAAVEFVNPKYYKDLSVYVSENYMGTGPTTYQCDVLTGDDDLIVPLPVNPIRPPQFPENEIPNPLPQESINIVKPEPVVAPYVYSLKTNGVSVSQYSSKILYKKSENKFFKTVENEIGNLSSVVVENGISNFLKNASFYSKEESAGSNIYPKDWTVVAPGFIVSSGLFESDIDGINFWQLHLTNPNSFSALDSIALKTEADIPIGTTQLSVSLRYQQFVGDVPAGNEYPFESMVLKNNFIASDGSLISQSTVSASVFFTSDDFWDVVSFSFPCPTSASRVEISLETSSISTTFLSTLRVLLPQLENCYTTTTPCITERVSDKIYSPSQLKFKSPVGFFIETSHTNNPEIRGFLELNQAGLGGLKLYLSNSRLNFRQVDSSGSIIFTAQSTQIFKDNGQLTKYGVFIDENSVGFYCDNVLISSVNASLDVSYFCNLSLGSLFSNNTAINSKLDNLVVTTVKPGV
jgi:hypothetical protein